MYLYLVDNLVNFTTFMECLKFLFDLDNKCQQFLKFDLVALPWRKFK